MSKVETLIEQIQSLEPGEIRERLARLDAEQKTLRVLLRTRLSAKPATAGRQGASETEAARP